MRSRYDEGKSLRSKAPRASHGAWTPSRRRRDPVELVLESSRGRIERLVPIRHGRMLQSPFAFYRGAASIMAADLARTPRSGLRVQACGDCHLLNFGVFATPERRRIFDINDFDETLPAPWEWDLKRLAASFAIAARHQRFSARNARDAATASAASYRRHMFAYAEQPTLDAWYARIDGALEFTDPALRREYERAWRREKRRDATREHHDLAHRPGRKPKIKPEPPLVYHPARNEDVRFGANVRGALRRYRESLPDERRTLFDRFELCDVAMKVVGVGSVGTVCAVALYLGARGEPLYLQVKEARASVLEPIAGASRYDNAGQRVVVGPAADADRERHLPRLDPRRPRPQLLRAPAPRLQDQARGRADEPAAHAALRGAVWLGARARARALGRRRGAGRLHGPEQGVRDRARALRAPLRAPERARLRGVRRGRPRGPRRGAPRLTLTSRAPTR
jgi:uncharacterized protein (DUF2252 family)